MGLRHPVPYRLYSFWWSRLCICMWWLRWVGYLKIQVSLQNTGLFCRALLQKRPIFLSILLIVATPYLVDCTHPPCRTNYFVGYFAQKSSVFRGSFAQNLYMYLIELQQCHICYICMQLYVYVYVCIHRSVYVWLYKDVTFHTHSLIFTNYSKVIFVCLSYQAFFMQMLD